MMAMNKKSLLTIAAVICLAYGCRLSTVRRASEAPAPDSLRFEVVDAPLAPVIDVDHPDLFWKHVRLRRRKRGQEKGVGITSSWRRWREIRSGRGCGSPVGSAPTPATGGGPRRFMKPPGRWTLNDTRFSLWAPMPVFNEREDHEWDLFYIAYRPSSSKPTEVGHMDGRVWRAVSRIKGRDGIGGPYSDVGIVLQPDSESQPWEGQQGTDSFYPWRAGGTWSAWVLRQPQPCPARPVARRPRGGPGAGGPVEALRRPESLAH